MSLSSRVLTWVFVAGIIVGVLVIGYLLAGRIFPSPATVTPAASSIDSGQSVSVGVGWKGGAAPYSITLYSSSNGDCSSSSTVAGTKTGLTAPQFIFTVSPTSTTRYCGQVSSSGGSSGVSPTVVIAVGPALHAPTLVLSPVGFDFGQTGTVTATVMASGGSPPYAVTLYSGTSSTCSANTKVVTVSSGSNPLTGFAGTTAAFSFAAPATGTYYCVTVVNGASVSTSSAAVKFDINPVFTASVSPGAPKLDSGQSVTLTASGSQGTPPYTYQWHSGSMCASPISGQTTSTFSTGSLTASNSYSVRVSDSSTGSPPAQPCEKSTVTVNSAFAGIPVTILPPSVVIDDGQSANLTVSWLSAGSAPYTVKISSNSSPDCSGASPTGLNMTGVFSVTAKFRVRPSSSTYYCAVVTDSASTPQSSSTTSSSAVTVNPMLAPRVSLSPTAIDVGQTASLIATVQLMTGTSPFTVTLFTGSSAACLFDTTIAAVTSGFNPLEGVGGPSASFPVPTPGTTTFYCATVTDGSDAPATATSASARFVVNQALMASISPGSPTLDSGQAIALSAVATLGTAPYTYQWYTGGTCTTAIAGQISSTFSTGVLNATKSYSVRVGDSSSGTPAATVCASTVVTVAPVLVASLLLSPTAIDAGQAVTVSGTVSWTGGATPYTVTLFSGSSSSCASDTAVVAVTSGTNPRSGISGNSTTFSFPAPGANKYYCASVKDSAATPVTVSTSTSLFAVNPAIGTVAFSIFPNVLDSGQAPISVTGFVSWSGGTSPYTVTLYSGSSTTCSSDTIIAVVSSGSNPKTGLATSSTTFTFLSPASNTYYCVAVKDSAVPTSTSSSTSFFAVNPALAPHAPAIIPAFLDTGQSSTISAAASWTGGTAPYTVTLRSGSSTSCASDTTVVAVLSSSNPQTGLTGTSASFSFASPGSTRNYCISVKDSSATPATVLSTTSALTFNPVLVAGLAPLSPAGIDSGQTTVVTATVSWSGGTSPFSASLFSGLSSNCAFDTTAVGTPKTNLIVSPTTFTFASTGSTTYYCAKVTDGSGVPSTAITATTVFTVHPRPTVSISPPSPSIGAGQSVLLLATASAGISPYTFQWYTGATCSTTLSGQTSPSYNTGVLSVTSTYSVKVTDSSVGTPSSFSIACATVTVIVGNGPEGIASDPIAGMVYVADPASNHISVIDSSNNTVVATVAVGTLPWGVAVDSVSATHLIYVSNYVSGTVSVIAGNNNTVIRTIAVGTHPTGIAVNPSNNRLYVANSGSNTVTVISTLTNAVIKTIVVGTIPQGVAIGPGPFYTVFVTNYGSNTISIIDSSYLVTTAPVGSNPWGVAVNPSTNRVFVTNSGSGTVSVINGSTFALVTTVVVGGTPEGIAINSGTSRAYVANAATNSLAEINTSTNTVITSGSPQIPIPTGPRPWGVALIPGSNRGYVTNAGSNTISVINLLTNEVIATIIVA